LLFTLDTNPRVEDNGTASYTLSNVDENVTWLSSLSNGLHKVVYVVRQPTQLNLPDSSVAGGNEDEATLFGVMVHYFVVVP